MSDIEKNDYDTKGVTSAYALEGPSSVDPGVYSGIHDSAAPTDGRWAKFNYYNRKLETKMGIETVSGSAHEHRNVLSTCRGV